MVKGAGTVGPGEGDPEVDLARLVVVHAAAGVKGGQRAGQMVVKGWSKGVLVVVHAAAGRDSRWSEGGQRWSKGG